MTATTRPAIVRFVRLGESTDEADGAMAASLGDALPTVTVSSQRGQFTLPFAGNGFETGTGALQYGQVNGISHPTGQE
jgi:hypothetical protein